MSARDRLDLRRIAAISTTLAVHIALLMLLLAEHPSPAWLPEEAIMVRLIPEPHVVVGVTAGANDATSPEAAPAPAEAPKAKPARSVATVKHRPPQPVEKVIDVGTLPPPTLAAIAPDTGTAFADTAVHGAAPPGVVGRVGSRHGGQDGSGNAESIRFIKKVEPTLPTYLRERHWSGYVLLGLRVRADGKLADVVVLRSSGERLIDLVAKLAARRSTYEPHRKNGKPIAFWAVLPVVFGGAEPDLDRDLATLSSKWRGMPPDAEAPERTRPAA